MSNTLSCSTSWNVHKTDLKGFTGYHMLKEISDLGFEKVELNYNVTEEMLRDMYPLLETGSLKVSSVHNVCPKANSGDFGPSSVFLGHKDQAIRQQAIDYTLKSVETAHRLGAEAVVIHAGKVEIQEDPKYIYTRELRKKYIEYGPESPNFKTYREHLYVLRQKYQDTYMNRVMESLETICNNVEKKKLPIKLGIENRDVYYQIPDVEEYHRLFQELNGAPVYLWFDIGHGEKLSRLGLFNEKEILDTYKHRLLGLHIHDMDEKLQDHYAPYSKSQLLDKYLEYMNYAQINVFELSQHNSPEVIKASLKKIRKHI